VNNQEALAVSILKSVRVVAAATSSVQVIRRMRLNDQDHDMSMILAIQGKKDLYIKTMGSVGEKFEGVIIQALRVWGLSLNDFISCGIDMLNDDKKEVNGMHILMVLRNRTGMLDDAGQEVDAHVKENDRPVLTLVGKDL
jgi:hypothetical protein